MSRLSEKQRFALNLVLSGHSLLLLGSAGTGKSFLVREIVEKCEEKGLRVSLTCTTGIACNIYSDPIKAHTIHQWSGINDGRYSPAEIKSVIQNNPIHAHICDRVRQTDLLIIDECSMLSKRMFECLSEVCSVRNEHLLFGGMQLVLCGDFLQLPPVPNTLCNEDGDYCFKSQIFSTVLPHKVALTNVFRQNEDVLIKAIHEVASGSVSTETFQFIQNVKRPLPDGENSTKLFSRNDHVDDYNRENILDFPGPVYEFVSNDIGERRYLAHILAPHVLWLKVGVPVILLRNLSDKLVNGLCDVVYDVQESTVIVEFPTLDIKVPLQKVKFSVFSRRENKDIAVREQLPLKLAFALTIHKSQGMTLDSVEVDCSGIFKPGQLGVAIGRAKSSAGLRILNFTPRACMPHPESVKAFLAQPSSEQVEDKSCCEVAKCPKKTPSVCTVQEMIALGIDTDIDLDGESDFDADFDEIIKAIDTTESDLELPHEIILSTILEKLKYTDPVTTFQYNTNSILNKLDGSQLTTFCRKEYQEITSLTDKIKFKGAVKCRDLGMFYTAMHKYHTSAEFLLKCMIMFEGECFTSEKKHICYNISVEIRKFILNKKAEAYPSTSMKLNERSVTNASRARIRYIGGYCIAKVRAKYISKKQSLRYAKTVENQQTYEEAVYATRLLNSLSEDEQYILNNTTEPESLLDITRRQYVNRGLTNISDETFNFFIKLSDTCLGLLIDKQFHQHGNEMFEVCKQKIMETQEIVDTFNTVLKNHSEKLNHEISTKPTKLDIDQHNIVTKLFQKILKIYLLVLFGQFRKDILDTYQINKKMAHRKQIQVSKSTKKVNKDENHEVKRKKLNPPSAKDPILEHDDTITKSVSSTTATEGGRSDSPVPCTSNILEEGEDDVLCKVCCTSDKQNEWIQCDSCSSWFHRNCAGLKHHMRWKKIQKKRAIFYCSECQ